MTYIQESKGMDQKTKTYQKMINGVLGVEGGSQHKKDVLKVMLRLYSHGGPVEDTEAAVKENERRKAKKSRSKKDDLDWVDLKIHHEHEIATITESLIERTISTEEALSRSLLRKRMTADEHSKLHPGKQKEKQPNNKTR